MPGLRVVIYVALLALAACSGTPRGADVIEQARPGGRVAFDVVNLDNASLTTVLGHQQKPFRDRFKQYEPPPELKVAVGDTVSVVIWESGSNGLYGDSLTELSFPAGVASQLGTVPPPRLTGVPGLPAGVAASPDLLAMLFGGSIPTLGAAANQTGAALGIAQGNGSPELEQFLDLATQTGHPGTRIPDQQVGSDGGITIPYAGRIEVAGRTPEQVERTIETRLANKALDPQALVVVSESAANAVSVTGDVNNGRRVELATGGDRLLQVIAAAGGTKTPVHDTVVQLTRDKVTASIPLAALVADPAQDIFAKPGDVVTLVRHPKTFSVFGATGKNSAIDFAGDKLSLSEALAKAGGLLDDRADPRAVFLFRYEPAELVRALGEPVATDAHDGLSPIVYRLDLSKGKSYLVAQRFPVHDKDVIFVADAPIQRVYYAFRALSQVTGPVVSGFLTCQSTGKC